jgi:hypothetical protein
MRTMTKSAIFLALILAACSPPAPPPPIEAPKAKSVQAATPPQVDPYVAENFAGCQLVQISGSGLSIWTYECPATKTSIRLVADASLPGFSLQGLDADNKPMKSPAVVIFPKAKDDPVSSITEAIRKVSPDEPGAGCSLVALPPGTAEVLMPIGRKRFSWEPSGKVKDAWEDFNSPSDDPAAKPEPKPPCGQYGPQFSGLITFEELEGDPTKVAAISWGSEIPLFLPETLRAE